MCVYVCVCVCERGLICRCPGPFPNPPQAKASHCLGRGFTVNAEVEKGAEKRLILWNMHVSNHDDDRDQGLRGGAALVGEDRVGGRPCGGREEGCL